MKNRWGSSIASDQKANLWFGILVGVPVIVMILALVIHADGQKAEGGNCLQRGGELQTVEGTLRQAGQDFFVVKDRWRKFAHQCAGKSRQNCLQRNPGIALLEQHVGSTVSVSFCEQSMLGYSVAGKTFGLAPSKPADR